MANRTSEVADLLRELRMRLPAVIAPVTRWMRARP